MITHRQVTKLNEILEEIEKILGKEDKLKGVSDRVNGEFEINIKLKE